MKNIACCIHLSWDYVPKAFLASCYSMWKYSVGKYNLTMLTCGGCYMDKAKDELAKKALKGNPDYILWLDADQSYPANTPEVLMKHVDDGKLIVGGVTPLRRFGDPQLDGKPSVWDLDSNATAARYRKISLHQGLLKVDAMGLGGIMTSPEVFKILEYPRFSLIWNKEEKRRLGVDLQFFANCKKAGIDVWCDTGLLYEHMEVRPIKVNAKEGMIEF